MPRTYGFRNGPSTGSGRRYGFGRPSVVGPVTRRPYRQGASEQTLVRASDSAAYANSGSPGFEFTTLEVESGIASGGTVGTPRLHDGVTGATVPGTTVSGLPGTTRFADIASPPGLFGGETDFVSGIVLPPGDFSIALYSTIKPDDGLVKSFGLVGTNGASFRGFSLYFRGAELYASCRTSTGVVRANIFATHPWSVTDTPVVIVATYSAAGALTCRWYRLSDGDVVIGASTGARVETVSHQLGGRHGSTRQPPAPFTLDVFDGVLLTPTQADAIASGADPTGGGTRTSRYGGLRTGAFNPLALSELPIASGAGLPVLAP